MRSDLLVIAEFAGDATDAVWTAVAECVGPLGATVDQSTRDRLLPDNVDARRVKVTPETESAVKEALCQLRLDGVRLTLISPDSVPEEKLDELKRTTEGCIAGAILMTGSGGVVDRLDDIPLSRSQVMIASGSLVTDGAFMEALGRVTLGWTATASDDMIVISPPEGKGGGDVKDVARAAFRLIADTTGVTDLALMTTEAVAGLGSQLMGGA